MEFCLGIGKSKCRSLSTHDHPKVFTILFYKWGSADLPLRAPTICQKCGKAECSCSQERSAEFKRVRRQYIENRRYDSAQWRGKKGLRQLVLARAMHLCQINTHCRKELPAIATQVDHIVQVSNGGAFDDLDNLQAACEPCHSAKTMRENASVIKNWNERG